ncbi:hypothetical protein GH714_036843 [Hevea brasiliensis]|uniref:C2H2-type domain-containing protein n=1 Tax=Hevea brasiliensis TaxID=3981 RepID=A0A6A6MM43_HEVBR|nr:hypothetical protein GH714_036843 [Hevea brasiliensis]
MFPAAMSNSTALSEDASVSTGNRVQDFCGLNPVVSTVSPQQQQQQQPKIKKKRSLPGNPDPDAEVIALSPKTLLATNRFVCEICNKGFQRDQNLQLHRRGHNLPWKLKQRNSKEIKKRAYVCPEPSCVHHHPSRALGDLTGIKKHYCRKHGRRNGSAKSVQRSMLFNQIGRLTLKPVELESIDVTVEPFSPGIFLSFFLASFSGLFFFFFKKIRNFGLILEFTANIGLLFKVRSLMSLE